MTFIMVSRVVEQRSFRHFRRCLSLLLILGSMSAGTARATPPESDDLRVETVVVLMRHGARSGLETAAIAEISEREWPGFGYADGQLTGHGRAALLLWGQYHRRRWTRQGLLPEDGRILPGSVVAFASPRQRTRDTANIFLEGLVPGHGIVSFHEGTADWFLTHVHGLRGASTAAIEHATVAGLGMSLEEAQTHYRPALRRLERQLSIADGRLSDSAWRVAVGPHGNHIAPLDVVDGLVENVRMQYVSNFPLEEVGFGHVGNQAALAELMSLRGDYYNASRYPRYLAVRRGQALLRHMAGSLMNEPGPSRDAAAAGRPAISLYVGHDGTMAAIRAILGFNWQIPEHLLNDVPPGSMLMFERVRRPATGEQFIRIAFHSQTNDQIRGLVVLGEANPPFVSSYEPAGSPAPSVGPLIRLADFNAVVQQALYDAADPTPDAEARLGADPVAASRTPVAQAAAAAESPYPAPFPSNPWQGSTAPLHFPGFMINPFSR